MLCVPYLVCSHPLLLGARGHRYCAISLKRETNLASIAREVVAADCGPSYSFTLTQDAFGRVSEQTAFPIHTHTPTAQSQAPLLFYANRPTSAIRRSSIVAGAMACLKPHTKVSQFGKPFQHHTFSSHILSLLAQPADISRSGKHSQEGITSFVSLLQDFSWRYFLCPPPIPDI